MELDKVISNSHFVKESFKKKDFHIPIGVFDNDTLSALEAIVKYLKEKQKLKFSDIARILKRSNKTIWGTYNNAIKKMRPYFGEIPRDIMIPASLFANRSFSTLECLVGFLKDLRYSNHEIAEMLHLDDRTIWTVYDRTKRKMYIKTKKW